MAATAVILDLDGTVWDSLPFYAAALGGDDADAVAAALSELQGGSPAATLLKNAGYTTAGFRRCCESGTPPDLYPGTADVLGQLHERGTPLGAVTNLPAWMAEPMLARHGLDELLASVVTAGRAKPGKPHPAPLLLCCEELDIDADPSCWYVGDSANDCQAALAAGMSFAWASWGYGASSPPGADVTLTNLADIASL
jgi:HAD superfamily hydrolase (TIGR01509 family)